MQRSLDDKRSGGEKRVGVHVLIGTPGVSCIAQGLPLRAVMVRRAVHLPSDRERSGSLWLCEAE